MCDSIRMATAEEIARNDAEGMRVYWRILLRCVAIAIVPQLLWIAILFATGNVKPKLVSPPREEPPMIIHFPLPTTPPPGPLT